jgi:DNA-binding transcriptional LysR family regulator
MNVEELRSFTVLAGHLHFGRAAEALHLTQPALTKQVRRLEDSVGGRLFDRSRHGTTLTTLGQRLVPPARELVASFDRLLLNAQKEAQGRGGRLRIGFGYYAYELAPRLVVELRRLEPDLEISLRDLSTAEQIRDLQAGELDIGFARLPLPDTKGFFASRPVLSGRLALALPSHRQRDVAGLANCREEPFVILSKQRSAGLYERILKLCAAHGFHPRIVQEVSELTTALALVRAGMGLSIIPESSWSRLFGGVRIQPLNDPAASWAVGAVWRRRDTNAALRRFLELLRTRHPASHS